jgi:hypothetical protein
MARPARLSGHRQGAALARQELSRAERYSRVGSRIAPASCQDFQTIPDAAPNAGRRRPHGVNRVGPGPQRREEIRHPPYTVHPVVVDSVNREVLHGVRRAECLDGGSAESNELPALPECLKRLGPQCASGGETRGIHKVGVKIDAVGAIRREKILLAPKVVPVAAAAKQFAESWTVGRGYQKVHVIHPAHDPCRIGHVLQGRSLQDQYGDSTG